MSKISYYFKETLGSQSPAMPIRIITGLSVSVLGFVWLPFGMLGLLILLWIVYVTKSPTISALSSAGGTDILVQMKSGMIEPDLIVDIKKIPGIRNINMGNNFK